MRNSQAITLNEAVSARNHALVDKSRANKERDRALSELAEARQLLKKIAGWPDSYPANANIERIRVAARAAIPGEPEK